MRLGATHFAWHAGLLSLKTLVFKLIGVTCSMAGGLIAGKEGPFIHTGLTAANLSPQNNITDSMHLHALMIPMSLSAAPLQP